MVVGNERKLLVTLEIELREPGEPLVGQWYAGVRIVKDLKLVGPPFDIGRITDIFREHNAALWRIRRPSWPSFFRRRFGAACSSIARRAARRETSRRCSRPTR